MKKNQKILGRKISVSSKLLDWMCSDSTCIINSFCFRYWKRFKWRSIFFNNLLVFPNLRQCFLLIGGFKSATIYVKEKQRKQNSGWGIAAQILIVLGGIYTVLEVLKVLLS